MMKENKNTFQFFKQRLDEAIGSFELDSQNQQDGGHDFFLKNLKKYSRFNWNTGKADAGGWNNHPKKSFFYANIDEGQSFWPWPSTLMLEIIQFKDDDKSPHQYYVILKIRTQTNKYEKQKHFTDRLVLDERIESADKVALVFIRNIDENIKRYFQSERSGRKVVAAKQQTRRVEPQQVRPLGFDQ